MSVEDRVKDIIPQQLGVEKEENKTRELFIDDLAHFSWYRRMGDWLWRRNSALEIPDEDAEKYP